DATGAQRIGYDPNGLDTEGLVRLRDGSFWVAEEYGPSLAHVDRDGKVLLRLLPQDLELRGADYPVQNALPAVYRLRKDNRGFESLALGRDGKTLFTMPQSPLLVPDKKTGDGSRLCRVLALDVATNRPRAEYVYRFEVQKDFDAAAQSQADMKVSGLAAFG